MATLGMIEYNDASPEVKAVYDDIMANVKKISIDDLVKQLLDDHLDGNSDSDGEGQGSGDGKGQIGRAHV